MSLRAPAHRTGRGPLSAPGHAIICAAVLLLVVVPASQAKQGLTYPRLKANEQFHAAKQASSGAGQASLHSKATTVNHFGADQYSSNNTYLQRYVLIPPTQGLNSSTPIFLFTASESPLEEIGVNSGYYSDLAASMGALQLWPEHRYYATDAQFTPSLTDYEFLNIEQAMSDQIELVLHVQLRLGLDRAPVIAIGGSYSGQLAAWLRIRYPDVIAGAISSSPTFFGAPGLGLDPSYDPYGYAKLATRTASSEAGAAAACPVNVQNFFKMLFTMAQTDSGLQDINTQLNICSDSTLQSSDDVNATLASYVRQVWISAAQYNFPYETPNSAAPEEPSPPFQVSVACKALAEPNLQGSDLMTGMIKALNVFVPNFTQPCTELPSPLPSGTFAYQVCTQDYTAASFDGVSDMFYDLPYGLDYNSELCYEAFGVATQYDWSPSTFGLNAIRQSGNIFFTAGIYDPYAATSPNKNISATVTTALYVGAHAQDLEPVDPADDPTANEARRQGSQNIMAWIAAYNEAIATVPTSNGADLFNLNFSLGGYVDTWNDTLPGSNSSRSTAALNASAPLTNNGV